MAFSDLDDYPNAYQFECDICIVGAGAAGITIAKSLLGKKIRVILLESGSQKYEQKTQNLYSGENIGKEYFNLAYDRLRFFGGSTNHWGGWCAPFSKEDFYKHEWIEPSGWPITKNDLDPFYEVAQEICGISQYKYLESDWANTRDFKYKHFNEEKVVSRVWQHSDYQFGKIYSEILKKASNLDVIFHANALEILPNKTGEYIEEISLSTLEHKKASVKAKNYIIASGGIENARLLLLSSGITSTGIGNDRDLVGRYFMDHLEGPTAKIYVENESEWFSRFSQKRKIANIQLTSGLSISYEARKKAKILHHSTTIESDIDYRSGYFSLKRILKGEYGNNFVDEAINTLGDIDEVFKWIYHRAKKTTYYPPIKQKNIFTLFSRTEVTPNHNSRVTLGNEIDTLGQRKINLDWQLSALDKHTIMSSNKILAEEMGRLRLGRVKLDDWVYDDTSSIPIEPGHHHLGTTRMSNSPVTGVVDQNCKVHGIDNLYIAGSSVFPTSSYVNPTLTIVALSLRLAEHLNNKS